MYCIISTDINFSSKFSSKFPLMSRHHCQNRFYLYALKKDKRQIRQKLKNLWNQYYDLKNILLQLTIIVLRQFTRETRVIIDTPGFKPMGL